ncbi:hypothetical protein QE152_g34816 [Popillia japonica]|uniref:F-box domain-containing protein n=1 Tax=Popillia japonica TaxID=7064 RepID=A0AAW1ITC9_POPJA
MDIKYICTLPFEVLECICFHLDTVDIIKLSELITEFNNVSCSKRVIQKINLFQEYYVTRQHLIDFLAVRPSGYQKMCIFFIKFGMPLSCGYKTRFIEARFGCL